MTQGDGEKTAVVIEDDADVRHMLADVLEAAGFSTISVGNGIDGVRAVETYQPLVTTLDVNLPGIDGYEAARRIRARSDTHIIMLTGQTEETDVVMGLAAGADDFIAKPFRPRELRARIEAMLRRPRVGGGAAGAPGSGAGGAYGAPGSAPAPRQDAVGPSFPVTRAQRAGERSWALVYAQIDDADDLRTVTGDAGFTSIVERLRSDVVEIFPTEADIGWFAPAGVAVLVAQPSTVLRERVRSLLRAFATSGAGVRVGTSASVGWAGVAEFGYDVETLLAAARGAAERAAEAGGDRWERAVL